MTYEQVLWLRQALLRRIRVLSMERVAVMLGSRYVAGILPRPRNVRGLREYRLLGRPP
ncbi:hypothetical protein [Kyrpidia spormannii]|uniref:hypothetical protein n=1 Tax=Kyrpidia spormannii TaxID=2055160 RepID=UPI001E5F92CF|nr:hypothetical protein [Kyrpidia spormannii]